VYFKQKRKKNGERHRRGGRHLSNNFSDFESFEIRVSAQTKLKGRENLVFKKQEKRWQHTVEKDEASRCMFVCI